MQANVWKVRIKRTDEIIYCLFQILMLQTGVHKDIIHSVIQCLALRNRAHVALATRYHDDYLRWF